MMYTQLAMFGAGGVSLDRNAESLDPGQWSKLENIDSLSGELASAGTDRLLVTGCPIIPLWMFYYLDSGVGKIFVSDGYRLYMYSSGAWANLADDWDGGYVSFCVFLGTLVVNSQTNGPFYYGITPQPTWEELDTKPWNTLSVPWNNMSPESDLLVSLPGWFTNATCLQMVAYKNFLVAIRLRDPARLSEYLYAWSASSPAGSIPGEWTPTATNDAGDGLLLDTPGVITAGLQMRDSLMIYKTDSIYRLDYTGGPFVMRSEKVTTEVGVNHPTAVTSLSDTHYLVTRAGLARYNGQNIGLLDFPRVQEKVRSWLRPGEGGELVVTMANPGTQQIWFAHKDTATGPYVVIFKFDLQHDSFTTHNYSTDSLTAICNADIDAGLSNGGLQRWDQLTTTPWTDLNESWNPAYSDYQVNTILMAMKASVNTGGGTGASPTSVISMYIHSGIPISASGNNKGMIAVKHGIRLAQHNQRVIIRGLYPVATGDGNIMISLGKSYQSGGHVDGDVIFDNPRAFRPGVTRRLPMRMIGDVFSLSISSNDGRAWKLSSVGIDYEVLGDRG